MKPTSLFVPLLAAAYASAHGFLATVTIDGKSFKGNVPQGKTSPSIIRQISDVSPIKGANNPDVNCGKDAKRASLNADANPGDTVTFDWRGGDYSFWPHNTGPMLTYMADCGDESCDQFDSTQAKWFKIQQVGRKSNGDWAQADLMKGAVSTITLPSNIAPGNYLIRHEIIALHLADQKGGAEFYPACAQLKVGGNGNGKPNSNELVSLPGAYSDNDPGIFDPSVFDEGAKYSFPGPQIASFVNGGDSGSGTSGGSGNSGSGDGGDDDEGTPTSGAGSSKPTGSSSSSSTSNKAAKCKLKKSTKSVYARASTATPSTGSPLEVRYYPRHVSRVMRNLAFGNTH